MIDSKLQHPPSFPKPGNPQAFDPVSYLTGREFEPCLVGVGNLNRSCYVCPAEYTFYLLIWGYLKQTVHFREQLTLKNRSKKKPRSLSCLLRKKETIKSGTRVGISNTILVPGTGFERTNLQKFKCQGGC